MTSRRAVILPTVLFVLLLLGLFGAMFAFRISADTAATRAAAIRMQTRLAAEAGLERVKLLLQLSREDMDTWYHNPDELNRILVWATGQQIDLLLPHVYQARFGDIGRESDSKTPRLGAMTLRVEDLGRTQDVLAGNDVAFGNPDEGTIRVGPEYACGVVLDFTEKSAR